MIYWSISSASRRLVPRPSTGDKCPQHLPIWSWLVFFFFFFFAAPPGNKSAVYSRERKHSFQSLPPSRPVQWGCCRWLGTEWPSVGHRPQTGCLQGEFLLPRPAARPLLLGWELSCRLGSPERDEPRAGKTGAVAPSLSGLTAWPLDLCVPDGSPGSRHRAAGLATGRSPEPEACGSGTQSEGGGGEDCPQSSSPRGAWRPVWPGSAWGSRDLGLVPIVELNSESLLLSCLSASFRKLGIHSETEKTLSLCLKNAMILACKTTKPNNQKAKANPLPPAVTRGEGGQRRRRFLFQEDELDALFLFLHEAQLKSVGVKSLIHEVRVWRWRQAGGQEWRGPWEQHRLGQGSFVSLHLIPQTWAGIIQKLIRGWGPGKGTLQDRELLDDNLILSKPTHTSKWPRGTPAGGASVESSKSQETGEQGRMSRKRENVRIQCFPSLVELSKLCLTV